MANPYETLPEGTDHVIGGAGVGDNDFDADVETGSYETDSAFATAPASPEPAATRSIPSAAEIGDRVRAKVDEKSADFKAQAGDKARAYAVQGKDKATSTLEDLVKLVDQAAGSIDEKVGAQYGDYARKASSTLAGFADTLREKDVDVLIADAREIVRKSPAIAAGAAAAIGFALARVVKAGAEAASESASKLDTGPTDHAPRP